MFRALQWWVMIAESIAQALLVLLFVVQFRGTAQIGFLFAPVTLVWFALIAITGAINIATHPGVFRAFDPSRAILREFICTSPCREESIH